MAGRYKKMTNSDKKLIEDVLYKLWSCFAPKQHAGEPEIIDWEFKVTKAGYEYARKELGEAISSALSQARQEGYDRGFKDGLKKFGREFDKIEKLRGDGET